jgi:hypothetical protein
MKIILNWPDKTPIDQFSKAFLQGMLNRLAVGYRRFGNVHAAEVKDGKKRVASSLAHYRSSHNTEFLIDVANYAMIEFMRPFDSKAHYSPSDSDPSPSMTAYFRDKTCKLREPAGK